MTGPLESVLKVSIIVVAALIAGVRLKKQSAALRHWVLAMAVLCSLATPLLSRIVPAWFNAPF